MKQRAGRPGGTVLLILVISGLLALSSDAAGVMEQPPSDPADPVRTLPADVMLGDEFEVTVTFTSPHDDFHAIGLSDLAPEGWDVSVDIAWTSPGAMDSHIPETGEAAYVWGGPYDAGVEFTVVYKVQIPSDVAAGSYTFPGGLLEYYIEGYPADSYIEPITGDVEVEVAEDQMPPGAPPVSDNGRPLSGTAIVALWIALGVAVIAGVVTILRRRRAQS